ncbi:MAG: InlB B-repeat-containing protein [Clostridia bacterium]|nr:InlB B-repeat-containing protein [Clostridia bacterium]
MKKFFAVVVFVLVLTLAATAFVACNPTEDSETPEGDQITITWYQGGKELKTEKVAKGSKATSWTPEAPAGKEFTGWYAEASLTQAFDFNKELTEDTDIFAKFTSNVHVADDKEYYLIGTGSGDMKQSGWDHANSQEHLVMTKKDVANANVYEITITMYAGDAFQICYGGTYDGQVGIGYVPGVEYADGVNRYDSNTYTAADKKYATVKDSTGAVVFEGHDEFNKEYWTWNVFLAEGQDGVYKIIYTTYPDHPADNKITYELVEKLEPLQATHEMYVIGSISNWDFSEDYLMAADDTKENFSFLLNIQESAEIKLRNKVSDTWYGVAEEAGEAPWTLGTGSANLVLEAGVYKIAYSVAEDKATVTPVEKSFWLAGVVNGGQFWNCGSGIEFEKVNDTTYKAYYTFTEADTDTSWMNGFVGACKAVYGYQGWDAEVWYGNETDGDNVTVESYGLYELVLTLDAEDNTKGTLSATKLEGYFLVGTIGDGDTWRAESQNKITVDGDTVAATYTWTEKDNADWLGADQIAAVKIINVDATGAVTWYGNATNGDNVIIPEVGTYTITLSEGVVTATKQ